jgi:hypothetical protein
VFPAVFHSTLMYMCHFLFAHFASLLYFSLYSIKRFLRFFTPYGTVPT